jgi:hypothetical protein
MACTGDILIKTRQVIRSCKTPAHIAVALKFKDLALKEVDKKLKLLGSKERRLSMYNFEHDINEIFLTRSLQVFGIIEDEKI